MEEEEKNTIKSLIFIKKQKSDRLKQLVVGDAPNLPSKWRKHHVAKRLPPFLCDFIFVQKRAPSILAEDYTQTKQRGIFS